MLTGVSSHNKAEGWCRSMHAWGRCSRAVFERKPTCEEDLQGRDNTLGDHLVELALPLLAASHALWQCKQNLITHRLSIDPTQPHRCRLRRPQTASPTAHKKVCKLGGGVDRATASHMQLHLQLMSAFFDSEAGQSTSCMQFHLMHASLSCEAMEMWSPHRCSCS